MNSSSDRSRFDPQRWQALLDGSACPLCTAATAAQMDAGLVAQLSSGRVVLQNDAGFRGYCVLIAGRHATELHQLAAAERAGWIDDVCRISAAIERVCRPGKLNYAILGNLVPHLHQHVVPRYVEDGWWGRSFSERPADARRELPRGEFAALRAALAAELRRG